MLGPAHRIADCGCLLRTGCRAECFSNFSKHTLGNPTGLFDQLGSVSGKVPLQNLIDAAGMLQREIPLMNTAVEFFSASVLGMPTAGAMLRYILFERRSLVCPRVSLIGVL